MDYRKLNSHIILLLLVGVVAFVLATLIRLAVLKSGEDVGAANLAFLLVLGVCVVAYLIIVSTLSNVINTIITNLNRFCKKKL